jgi:hypothetical protein
MLVCPVCNKVVATYDPNKVINGGNYYHSECYRRLMRLMAEMMKKDPHKVQ